ncbi:MAG: homocysteine S-methyltransferase family protein [bacterium]|nr:homocysteine S-methyltransferase family protein [bacterium]
MGGDVYGIMHSSIEATGPGLEVLRGLWDGPVMAYPETLLFDPAIDRNTLTAHPVEFANACRGWVDSGVQIIGGCCGTTIEHIRAMVAALEVPREAA